MRKDSHTLGVQLIEILGKPLSNLTTNFQQHTKFILIMHGLVPILNLRGVWVPHLHSAPYGYKGALWAIRRYIHLLSNWRSTKITFLSRIVRAVSSRVDLALSLLRRSMNIIPHSQHAMPNVPAKSSSFFAKTVVLSGIFRHIASIQNQIFPLHKDCDLLLTTIMSERSHVYSSP